MTSFSYFLKGVQSNDCCCSTKMVDKSQPECFEIVPNRKGKANMWKHFGFIKEPDKPHDKTSWMQVVQNGTQVLRKHYKSNWPRATETRNVFAAAIDLFDFSRVYKVRYSSDSKAVYTYQSAVSIDNDYSLQNYSTVQTEQRAFLVRYSSLLWRICGPLMLLKMLDLRTYWPFLIG